MSLNVAANTVVSIHYTLTDTQGNQLDSSEGHEPLVYLQGASNIIVGLENALEGKAAGDKLNVVVQPEEAYGEVQAELVQEVPREAFQGVDTIEVGMMFEAQAPDGSMQRVEVKDVSDETVVVDANHPLAGVVLNFSVEVVDVREASAEEIEHGHVHGPGGHQH